MFVDVKLGTTLEDNMYEL